MDIFFLLVRYFSDRVENVLNWVSMVSWKCIGKLEEVIPPDQKEGIRMYETNISVFFLDIFFLLVDRIENVLYALLQRMPLQLHCDNIAL